MYECVHINIYIYVHLYITNIRIYMVQLNTSLMNSVNIAYIELRISIRCCERLLLRVVLSRCSSRFPCQALLKITAFNKLRHSEIHRICFHGKHAGFTLVSSARNLRSLSRSCACPQVQWYIPTCSLSSKWRWMLAGRPGNVSPAQKGKLRISGAAFDR